MRKYYFAIACIVLSIVMFVVPIIHRYDGPGSVSATVGPAIVLEEGLSSESCAMMGMRTSWGTRGFPFTTLGEAIGSCEGGTTIYPMGALLDIIIAVNIIYFAHNISRWRTKR